MKRRDFLKYSAATTVGLLAASHSRILGANEDIRVGIIGTGGKGCAHADHLTHLPGVRVVALADPDPAYKMANFKDELAKRENPVHVDIYTDFRELLDRKDIDAVVIASCNHWHSLHAIYALNAGKHVYVEKPVSHDVWEGRQMVKLAAKTGLVVQAGFQHRSRHCWPEIMEYLKEGHLGKIVCSRGLCYKRRDSIGLRSTPLAAPKSCDYDLWLGPAQDIPMMRKKFHYDWHWVWNTGDADIGNQGVHQVDIARWVIGQNSYPERIFSIGGRFGYEDAGQTPNTQIIYYDYKPIPVIFEVRGLPVESGINAMPIYKKARIGNVIECEGGYVSEDVAYDSDGKRLKKFSAHGEGDHMPKFLEAIRNHRPQDVGSSIEDGHISSAMCHIANTSHRLGQQMPPAEIAERLKGQALMTETWERFVEHLGVNDVDVAKSLATFGPTLTFDASGERYTGAFADEANAYIKGNYREKWAIPAIG